MTLQSHHQAYFFACAAVFLWSTVATAFKLALAFFTPLQLVFVAAITSAISLTFILVIQKKLTLIKKQLLARPLFYLLTGLLNPFLYYLVLFKGYDLLPAQQALSLNYTWAILLPLLCVPLLGQQLKISDIVAAIIAYSGVLIIATNGEPTQFKFDNTTGIIMILLSTLLWCIYWIINTKDRGDPVVSLLLSFLIGIPFILIALLCTDGLPNLQFNAFVAGIYVGLFEMGITFVLWLMALKKAQRAASISTLIFISPVMSIGFIAWILGEEITRSTYVGLTLILTALLLQQLLPKLHRKLTREDKSVK